MDSALSVIQSGAFLIFFLGLFTFFYQRLFKMAQVFLVGLLLGYMFFNRSFANIGIPPVFIGEIVLITTSIVLILKNKMKLPKTWLVLPLAIYMLLGFLQTIPYISKYNVDSLRDGVVWGYGFFVLLTYNYLGRKGLIPIMELYQKIIPYFLVWVVASSIVAQLLPRSAFNLPGSDVSVFHLKSGDTLVHLSGIFAFLALDFRRKIQFSSVTIYRYNWLVWFVLIIAVLVRMNRAGMVTILVVFVAFVLLRPFSSWIKVVYICTILAISSLAFNLNVDIGNRTISTQSLSESLLSVFGHSDLGQGSRGWRLEWWQEIIEYTVFGDYFWQGKGFGINLANEDGFQVKAEGKVRSPHNSHMTILARTGVPGFISWIVLNLSILFVIVRTSSMLKKNGSNLQDVPVWIGFYILAQLTNMSFDIYLEGPPGGILYWCFIGVIMWLHNVARVEAIDDVYTGKNVRLLSISTTK